LAPQKEVGLLILKGEQVTVQQPDRPQPVRNAATVTAVTASILAFVAVLVQALVLFHFVDWDTTQQALITALVSAGLGVVTAIVALWKGGTAAEQVTPLENPHLDVGTSVNDGAARVISTVPTGDGPG
jgi:lysylphosphatidylglycerol synthetase-like protein (DUF2156 family)